LSKNFFSKCFFALLFAVGAYSLLFFFAPEALAATAPPPGPVEAHDLGSLFCNAFVEAKSFGTIFNFIAYAAGALATVKGIHHLKLHVDAPQNNKLGVGLMYLTGAAGLLVLPNVVGLLQDTLGNTFEMSGGGSGTSCVAGPSGTTAQGLDDALKLFVYNIKEPLIDVASIVAILAGLFMIVNGLIKASKYGTDPRTYSMHSILTNFGFGAVLMTIGNMMNTVMLSIFGTEKGAASADGLAWGNFNNLFGGDAAGLQRFEDAVTAALNFVQIIGVIAFVRGWLILKKVFDGSGNASLAQGLTHIIGGVLAINIFEFLKLMDKTFGLNLFAVP